MTYRAVRREVDALRSKGWLTTRRGDKLTLGSSGRRCREHDSQLTPSLTGAVTIILTGNGANQDVRSYVSQVDEIDMFIDARTRDVSLSPRRRS